MAWTTPTLLFFVGIAAALLTMTVWEQLAPTTKRRGFLRFETTRGDRFFLGLLSSAFVHLAWLGLLTMPVWGASLLAALWFVVLLRWG